ncbi:MAG: hypothetical protein HLUCCA01_03695 [Bacteroidetes bacterium HLUCCA01]|nr:MAG: hypothetical protein HLUCCA01_03695 [Bacteroidetes bacterium HLUCCA01]
MRPLLLTLALLLLTASLAPAQYVHNPYEPRLNDPKPPELQFIGYSFTRTTLTNIMPLNDVIQGQVIGRLFGTNSTQTVDRAALYTEQRFVPMFIYTPDILDGYATFRGLFKIDYTYGDQAYGVGNNRGGGLSGGQVNLQTLMANVDLRPPGRNYNVVLGLQRIFDNARDPNVNTLDLAQTTGYKLSYWGTQGVGATVFWRPIATTHVRFGAYQLWENIIARDDDVSLFMADLLTRPVPKLEWGVNLWYLRDTASNRGGVSVLGQGLTSALSEYNGAVRIRIPGNSQEYKADMFWLGSHASWNRDFVEGPWMADGYVMANLGTIAHNGGDLTGRVADVAGVAVNASVQYKYGMTARDRIWMEVLHTTGDGDGVDDGNLNSVITGNVWGSPVGIYSAHKAFLLFPDPQVVSRYYSAVHDISNMGLGVTGLFLNAQRDIIPNRFSARIGTAAALSTFSLPGGGNVIGGEVNAEVKYNLKVFLTLGLSGGYAFTGDFYDAPRATSPVAETINPINPWTVFVSLSWLMF